MTQNYRFTMLRPLKYYLVNQHPQWIRSNNWTDYSSSAYCNSCQNCTLRSICTLNKILKQQMYLKIVDQCKFKQHFPKDTKPNNIKIDDSEPPYKDQNLATVSSDLNHNKCYIFISLSLK